MCEIGPKVLRKVYVIFQDLSRKAHMGPYGPQPGPGPSTTMAIDELLHESLHVELYEKSISRPEM